MVFPERGSPLQTDPSLSESDKEPSLDATIPTPSTPVNMPEAATEAKNDEGNLRRSGRKRKQCMPYGRPEKMQQEDPFKKSGLSRTPRTGSSSTPAAGAPCPAQKGTMPNETPNSGNPGPSSQPTAQPDQALLLEQMHAMLRAMEERMTKNIEGNLMKKIEDAEKKTATRIKRLNEDISKRLEGAKNGIRRLEAAHVEAEKKIATIQKEKSDLPVIVQDLVQKSLEGTGMTIGR